MKVDRRSFMAGMAALAAAPSLSFAGPTSASTTGDRRAPMHRRLFLDDVEVDQAQGLEFRGHAAKRYPGNPLITRKYPWENTRFQLYGHDIVYNSERKLYLMFYMSQPHPQPWPNVLVGGKKKGG